MGVPSMDIFLKSLLVERSDDIATFANPLAVVVDDNARHHPERWSELPRRVRCSLLVNNIDPTRLLKPKLSPKKNLGRCNSTGSEDRWTSCGDGSPKQRRPAKGKQNAPLAPPSCPQRQQSIEVTAETLAHAGCTDMNCTHASHAALLAPSCPQRRQSVEINHPSHNKQVSPNSVVLASLSHVPKMPERQASDDAELYSRVPPPPMGMSLMTAPKITSAPLLGSFSSSVKRSKASLLDDDDDSDDEDDAFMGGSSRYKNVPKPQLLKNFTF